MGFLEPLVAGFARIQPNWILRGLLNSCEFSYGAIDVLKLDLVEISED